MPRETAFEMPSLPALFGALGLALACLAAGWLALGASAAEPEAAPVAVLRHVSGQVVVDLRSPLRQTLLVEPVAERDIALPLVLPAVIEADPARLVKVLPPASGRIVSIDRRLGDAVHRGELLARIDAPDAGQARSDVQKAELAVALAGQALVRQRALERDEIAAARDVDQAKNDLAQAQSELQRARSKLAQLGAPRNTVIELRSPIEGHVVELAAAPGAFWNDSTAALMTLADVSSVVAGASVGETELHAVFAGQPARVALDAYPGETLATRVGSVGTLLDADTRRVKLRLPLDNRSGRLKPGMFAEATLATRPHRGLSVPLTAVVQNGFHARVFVAVLPWHFEPRVVTLGPRLGDRVEIVAGLAAGERIVVRDAVLLDD